MSEYVCPICRTQHDTTACPTPRLTIFERLVRENYGGTVEFEKAVRLDERRRVIEELREKGREKVDDILYEIKNAAEIANPRKRIVVVDRILTALLGEPEKDKKRWKPKDGRCVCDWDTDKITWLNPSCPVHLQDAPTRYRDMVVEQEGK